MYFSAFGIFGGNSIYAPPDVLFDGNTVAWYDMKNIYVIKDGSDFVSQCTDRSGNGHHLLQTVGTNQPTWSTDGVLFDGIDAFMKATGFTLVQPEFIYIVFRAITWTASDYVFDGNTDDSGLVYQNANTPGVKAYAGGLSSENANLPLEEFGVMRVLFNGASSKLIINATTPVTGNFGASDMGGFTLARQSVTASGYGHIQVKEVIIRSIVDAAIDEAAIYAYLKVKYSL